MALLKSASIIPSAVEVICRNDDAIDMKNSDFDEYQKTGDQKHLKFIPDKQPTIFVCNFKLLGKERAKIMNNSSGVTEDGERSLSIGSMFYAITKYCLKDIRYPEGTPEESKFTFKKDKDGFPNDETIGELDSAGVSMDIAVMFNAMTSRTARPEVKNS